MINPLFLSALSIVLGVTAFLVLFEGADIGSKLIKESSVYFHRESEEKGIFGFNRKNGEDSSMHLSDGLYIDTETAQTVVKYVVVLILSIVCIFTQFVSWTLSMLWPVGLRDIYHIYHGQPGSILTMAYKCSLAKVSYFL